jgi:hypothetical protein
VLTNSIDISVFLNSRLKEASYRFMLSTSITNVFYLLLAFPDIYLSDCLDLKSSQTYFAAFFQIAIDTYLTSCLAIFRILVDVTLSLHTFRILINKNWFDQISNKHVLVILFATSLLYFAQEPFAYAILEVVNGPNNTNHVHLALPNDFGNSLTYKWISILQYSNRIFMAVVVLTIVNVLNVFEFKKRFRLKINKKSANLNITNIQTERTGLSSFYFDSFKNVDTMMMILLCFQNFKIYSKLTFYKPSHYLE